MKVQNTITGNTFEGKLETYNNSCTIRQPDRSSFSWQAGDPAVKTLRGEAYTRCHPLDR